MATPTFLRYLPARLKPLGAPAIWGPLTIFCLLSAFIWEYHRNPNWFDRGPIASPTTESGLTPEEEARLAEIDTLEVLLQDSRLPEGSPVVDSIFDPDVSQLAEAASENANDLSIDPFAYADEYRFPGTGTVNLTPTGSSSSFGASSNQSASQGNTGTTAGLGNPGLSINRGGGRRPSQATSALSEALNRQQTNTATEESLTGSETAITNTSTFIQPSAGGTPTNTAPAAAPGTIAVPFVRTTSEMSPPPGTTGYQAPATSSLPIFNTAPPTATPNPYSVPPTAPRAVTPATVDTSLGTSNTQSAFPSTPPQTGTLYTTPTSVQPEQPEINRRRR